MPSMTVTHLPPRPFFSSRMRTMPSPTDAGRFARHTQPVTGRWHCGHSLPPSVRYTGLVLLDEAKRLLRQSVTEL